MKLNIEMGEELVPKDSFFIIEDLLLTKLIKLIDEYGISKKDILTKEHNELISMIKQFIWQF